MMSVFSPERRRSWGRSLGFRRRARSRGKGENKVSWERVRWTRRLSGLRNLDARYRG